MIHILPIHPEKGALYCETDMIGIYHVSSGPHRILFRALHLALGHGYTRGGRCGGICNILQTSTIR
jgi:hypothetical protein